MKIAFLIYCLGGGGAERMVSRLANGMVKRKIDVDIIIFDSSLVRYEFDSRVSIIDAKVDGTGIKRDLKRIMKIRKYIGDKKPDILCCFIMTTLPYAVAAAILKEVKIIGAERRNPKDHAVKDRIRMKMVMPFCDGFIFQTKGAKEYYDDKVKYKSAVIGNIAPISDATVVMSEGIVKDICTVGRLCKEKDFDTLFRAFVFVVEWIPDARLHIYGEGEEEVRLIALSKELGIEDNIVFEGFHEDMSEEYLKYEIFVLSSKSEGMPNALLEAMALGMACISSDCDFGPADLIKDGNNGILISTENPSALSKSILLLMQKKNLRKSIGIEAAKISDLYSEENIISKYIEFFDRIIR